MRINQITPFLHVPDLERALERLCGCLEFEVLYREPGYAYLELDGHGLRVLEEPGRRITPDGRSRMTVYIDVPDVDSRYRRLAPKLATLSMADVEPPRDKPWKQREFMVRLPDGDWMAFGQASEVRPSAGP